MNAALICDRIAHGYSNRQIGRELGCSGSKIVDWANEDPQFGDQYAHAMQLRMDYYAHEIAEIADEGTNDWMEREGIKVPDHEHINRSRLRVDTRKWLMSKLAPKKFGDKLAVTGAEGGPIELTVAARREAARELVDKAFGALMIEHEASPADGKGATPSFGDAEVN